MSTKLNVFEHLRKYAVYRRAFLSYVTLSALTVVVVSGVLLAAFGGKSLQDITASGEAILTQTARAVDLLKEQVRTVGSALIEEETVVASLRADEIDRLREYHTNLVFNKVRSVYPFIRFVAMYNGTTDRYVNPEGITSEGERDFIQWIAQSGPQLFFSSFVRRIEYMYPRLTDSGTVVSFVLRPDLRLQRSSESFILVNVELEYVENLIFDLGGGFGGNVLVASEGGDVVVGSDDPALAGPAFMAQLLEEVQKGDAAPTFRLNFGGKRYVVTYARAPELGWWLFGVRPLSQILANSFALAWMVLGIVAVLLVTGAGLSLVFANRIYDPLSRLVAEVERNDGEIELDTATAERINEYEVLSQAYTRFASRVGLLEGALDSDMPLLRRTYVHSVLTGIRVDLPDNSEIADRVVAGTEAASYAVALCRVDRLARMRRSRSAASSANLLLLVSRSCNDALSDLGISIPLLLEGDEIAVFVAGENLTSGGIVERLHEVQVRLGTQAECTISCSVSSIVSNRDNLHDSLLEARRLLRYRFFAGPSSVTESGRSLRSVRASAPFPAKLYRHLVESLRLSRREEALALLSEFQSLVMENSYQGALAMYHQVSVDILAEFEQLQAYATEAFETYRRFIEDLPAVEFASDVSRALGEFCVTIIDVLLAEGADKTQELIRQAVDLVEQNYADPNLSLDSVAAQLHVSAGHLGRVFAGHSDSYLGEYVNRVRIDHAKRMLAETDSAVQSISEAVGLTNPTYFFTLFKRKVGTTPARYRRRVQGD